MDRDVFPTRATSNWHGMRLRTDAVVVANIFFNQLVPLFMKSNLSLGNRSITIAHNKKFGCTLRQMIADWMTSRKRYITSKFLVSDEAQSKQ